MDGERLGTDGERLGMDGERLGMAGQPGRQKGTYEAVAKPGACPGVVSKCDSWRGLGSVRRDC